jgi:hypothetical protein
MLVLANDDGGLYTALQKQWARYMNSSPHIDCYFIKGRMEQEEDCVLEENSLYIKVKEGYGENIQSIWKKMMHSFAYFKDTLHRYDFLFSTNVSSFIRFDTYLEACKRYPTSSFCTAAIGTWDTLEYPSGCGFTLSIDLVKRFIEDPPTFYKFDDVTVGVALQTWGVPIVVAERMDFDRVPTHLPDLGDCFHFRIKTRAENRLQNDIHVHQMLYDACYKTPRVLMLLIANDDGGLYTALQKQWARYMNSSPHIDCYFIKGREEQEEEYILEENSLYIRTYEGYDTNDALWKKTLASFKYFKPALDRYDFVYRTNLSSFVRFDRYLEACRTYPTSNLCAALIGIREGIPFPSGSGFTLSIDIVKRFIDDPPAHHIVDDVTVGMALQTWGIPIVPVPRIDFVDSCTVAEFSARLPTLGDAFHVRVRTANAGRLERDLQIYRSLCDIFYPRKTPTTTVVTMFFDLKALPDNSSALRPIEFYLAKAHGTLQIPNPMVIFCDADTRPKLQAIRDQFVDSALYPTVYIEKTITDYEIYTANHAKVTENRKVVPSYNASRNTPSYCILTMFKLAALQIAAARDDFGSSHYAWIDIGGRHIFKGAMLKPAIQMLENPAPKVCATYIHYRRPEELNDMVSYTNNGPCGIAAGVITVEKDYATPLYEKSMAIFDEMLQRGVGHSEETVLTYCYDRHPELFTLSYGDYYSLLANYVCCTDDYHPIRWFFIQKALDAGRRDLAIAAAKKVLAGVDARRCIVPPSEVAFLRGLCGSTD